MLVRLAEQRATGALLRDTGTLYLLDGAVVHAESPAAPGIEVLLTVGGRLSAEAWQEAVRQGGAQGRTARWLLDHHRLSEGELEISELGTLFDAAFFVLAPTGGPTRFRHGAAHWFGPVRPVPLSEVERESRRRRRFLDTLWPCPQLDAAPVRPRHDPRLPPATRHERAVLDLADGVRTPSAIAALLGRPAFHALVHVRRLAANGRVAVPPPATGRAPVPAPAWFRDIAHDADAALLRRLRDALEHL
ncbi:transcriptional regulator [Streptomyces sp. NPDC087270]|uniref:transcriptional regulator n=1 Tax=Streptomyces sp. NPDC087270 TaxID=3365774 RepID=UPI0038296E03